ncbi:MAG: isoprenylcysteine carboxylmethyltransferase family protein [Bacteroidetes bacterium]|nr:isoprenylcysteine carboxylmethyltransferase family protein [Bacteroidota bacterium]
MVNGLNLKVPPVLVGVVVGCLQWGVTRLIPQLAIDVRFQLPLALFVTLTGCALIFLGTWTFKKHATTLNPLTPRDASALVTSGVYRWTRNPMYLGMMIILVGWSIGLGNIGATALVLVFGAYITQFQIKPEEAILTDLFPDDYPVFCDRTNRWL